MDTQSLLCCSAAGVPAQVASHLKALSVKGGDLGWGRGSTVQGLENSQAFGFNHLDSNSCPANTAALCDLRPS